MNQAPGQLPTGLKPLDRRLNLYSPQIAETRLQGQVEAAQFLEGTPAQVIAPVADFRIEPSPASGLDCQLRRGATLRVFDEREGWCWVKSDADGYVGWTPASAIRPGVVEPTHMISASRTFTYPGPDMKLPPMEALSMGSRVTVVGEAVTRGTPFLMLDDGSAVIARHLRLISETDADPVEVGRRLLATPYLWGGSSAFGIDCSGFVQLCFAMCGRSVMRDSDMLAATLGEPIDPGNGFDNLRRGDLIFWRGHVALVEGDGMLLHANGYTMDVRSEPLLPAIERIATLFERPIGCRRPLTRL